MSGPRIEKDTFGPIEVPADRLWGAQTERSRRFFRISGERMPIAVGPIQYGAGPARSRTVANTEGSASSVCITDRSSAACTIGQVECVTMSSAGTGGGRRLNSVK